LVISTLSSLREFVTQIYRLIASASTIYSASHLTVAIVIVIWDHQ
jgi:hypothetical protein